MICLPQNRKSQNGYEINQYGQQQNGNSNSNQDDLLNKQQYNSQEDENDTLSQNSSSLNSNYSKNSNNSSNQRAKLSEEVFQMMIFEEVQESENIKVYDENEWKQVITGKSRKYTSYLELRSSLRSGISRKQRPSIWFWLTDLKKLEKKYASGIFHSLSNSQSVSDKAIQLDVQRTNVSSIQRKMIFKILRAYSNIDPEIGYTQGMNYVVSGILNSLEILMSEQNKRQEYVMNKAFWIFVYICHELNWREVYKNKMQKALQMLLNLETQIKKQLPDIYQHMKKLNVEVTLCFCEQFVTILLQQSPISFQKRTLDLFLLEGEKLIYNMLIRFMQLTKKEILQKNTMEDLVQFMKRDLVNYCYDKQKNQLNKLFPMPQNEITQSKMSPLMEDNNGQEQKFFRSRFSTQQSQSSQ